MLSTNMHFHWKANIRLKGALGPSAGEVFVGAVFYNVSIHSFLEVTIDLMSQHDSIAIKSVEEQMRQ